MRLLLGLTRPSCVSAQTISHVVQPAQKLCSGGDCTMRLPNGLLFSFSAMKCTIPKVIALQKSIAHIIIHHIIRITEWQRNFLWVSTKRIVQNAKAPNDAFAFTGIAENHQVLVQRANCVRKPPKKCRVPVQGQTAFAQGHPLPPYKGIAIFCNVLISPSIISCSSTHICGVLALRSARGL